MLGQAYAMPSSGVSVRLMLSLYTQCFPTPQSKRQLLARSGLTQLGLEFG